MDKPLNAHEPSPATRIGAPALAQIAASGAAWSFIFTLFARGGSMLSQLVLARLLLPADYGLVSLALMVATVPSIIGEAGVSQILVQRQHEFARLANASFWLALTLSLLAALFILASAPFIARFYHSMQLIPLIAVLALLAPLNSVVTLPQAKLQIELRLKLLALIGSATAILTATFSVVFAWFGMGAMSLILPMLVVAIIRIPVLWWLGSYPVKWCPDFHLWREFVVDGAMIVVTSVCWSITARGDYAILGRFASKEIVGHYYFAFGLSMQTVQLLGQSLSGVLFPTLSRLRHDPIRQRDAFVRAVQTASIITVPAALLPAVCPASLIVLFFGAKWLPAVPLLRMLSIAAALANIGLPASSYLISQHRNRTALLLALSMAIYFVTSVAAATWTFNVMGTTVAATVFQLICCGSMLYLALLPFGNAVSAAFRVVRLPIVAACVALVPGVAVAEAMMRAAAPNIAVIFTSLATAAGIYGVIVHFTAPHLLTQALNYLLRRPKPVAVAAT
jgi:O-antigen/teichoic acid export membrane protein